MIRTYIDWVLEVPWSTIDRGPARSGGRARRARRRPLRPRQGQGADRRVSRGPQAQGRHEGPDPLLRRAARRRQDVARSVDRPSHAAQVRAHLARRRARRSRDPRPPAHLHRLAARTHRAGAEAGRLDQPGLHARRSRQARRRLFRAIPPRPCSRCSTRRRTTASATTISKCRSISRRCSSSPRPTSSAPMHPALLDRMEIIQLSGYTEEDKVHIARRFLIPRQLTEHGLTAAALTFDDVGAACRDRGVHARGRRAQPRTPASAPSRARSRPRWPRRRPMRRWRRPWSAPNTSTTTWGRRASRRKSRSAPRCRAWRPAWPGRRPAATCCSSKPHCCPAARTRSSSPVNSAT